MPKPTLPPKRPVLWVSNSATAGTGYGMQTAQVTQRIQRAGHPTAIASNYGQEATIGTWNGISCTIILANDNALQGTTVTGTASGVGTLCARVYDVGKVTSPLDYQITVIHP